MIYLKQGVLKSGTIMVATNFIQQRTKGLIK